MMRRWSGAHAPPEGFVAARAEGAWMLVRRGFEADARDLAGFDAPDDPADTVSGGRVPHPVVTLRDGRRAVVRQYRRGGMIRHVVASRYLFGHRAFDEVRATEAAAQGGARVPTVIVAVERPRFPGYTATLVTLMIEDALPLAALLAASPGGARELMREAGRQAALVHAAGVAHPDLNLHNLLAHRDRPWVWVLDFDRARTLAAAPSARVRAAELRRLARSARKLGAPLGAAEWRAFRDGYGPEWPLPGDLG